MAATVPVENPGETSPLMEAAVSIGQPPDEKRQDAQSLADSLPAGSYERFMATFARSMR